MNAKKQARRIAAAKRFVILTFPQYMDMICDPHRVSGDNFAKRYNNGPSYEDQYKGYVERKKQEAAALGL